MEWGKILFSSTALMYKVLESIKGNELSRDVVVFAVVVKWCGSWKYNEIMEKR